MPNELVSPTWDMRASKSAYDRTAIVVTAAGAPAAKLGAISDVIMYCPRKNKFTSRRAASGLN